MNAIREEILGYINDISDEKLQALKPVLQILADESIVIETDLTEEEKNIIEAGKKEYAKGGFISLKDVI